MNYEPKDIPLNVRIGATEKRVVEELKKRHGSEGEVVRCALRAYGHMLGMDVRVCGASA